MCRGIHLYDAGAAHLGLVSLDPDPHPFRPAKDVLGAFVCIALLLFGLIAVPGAAGPVARQSASGRFAAHLGRL
jgi:hypothetical protein